MIVDFTIGAHHFHDRLQVGLHEIRPDLGNRLSRPLCQRLTAHKNITEVGPHILRRHQGHHQRRETLHRTGLRRSLWGDVAWLAVELQEEIKRDDGPLLPLSLAGGVKEGPVGDGREALAEDVTAHAERIALGRHGEMEFAG